MPAREETYQKVMTTLYKLPRKGAAITVKAVVQQAGIARATLYNDAELLKLVQSFKMQQYFESGTSHRPATCARAASVSGSQKVISIP
jgi:hypothetical protein